MTSTDYSHPHHITFTAYIDSVSRTSGESGNFTTKIDLPPNNFNRVCLLQASIPKSWYLFDSTNNTFILKENSNQTTITIPVGNYTRISLASVLSLLLTNASKTAPLGDISNYNTYSINYPTSSQTNTNKYIYSYITTGVVKNASFLFQTNNCCIPLGFNNSSTNVFTSLSLQSVNAINLSSKTRLYIKSNLCQLANRAILQEIFSNSVQDNGLVVYQQNEITANSKLFFSNSDNVFSFQLCDRFDNPIQLNGLDWTCSIYFYTEDDTNQYIKNNIILQNLQNQI